MKTPEKIKKGLACCVPVWQGNHRKTCSQKCPYIGLAGACREQLAHDAIAYIRQLETRLPAWIRVSERLPKSGEMVIVNANGKPRKNITMHNAPLIASYWEDEGWIVDGYEEWSNPEVTHWIPLPDEPGDVSEVGI